MTAGSIKRLLGDQRGQALPIVLCLLVVGGLTVAGSLSFSASALKAAKAVREGTDGAYAAGAGVEQALWSLKKGYSPPAQLPENINGMIVDITTSNRGNYTLSFGTLYELADHYCYIAVDGSTTWDQEAYGGAGAHKYTIRVTYGPCIPNPDNPQTIHLEEVGARIPLGYAYREGSPALFGDNIDQGDAASITYLEDGSLVRWLWSGGDRPALTKDSPELYQSFYLDGQGSQEGEYAWVQADPASIGMVSEITGTLYRVTATAKHSQDGMAAARIMADVVVAGGTVDIASWRITR
ncbi:MAG: hypothetical protein V1737_03400 [Chloroflexota bacterium]